MLRLTEKLALALVASLLLSHPMADAGQEARFWISPSAIDPFWRGYEIDEQLPIDLMHDTGAANNPHFQLFIWAQPGTDLQGSNSQLQNLTLDVVSTNPLIDFINQEIILENPLARFSTTRDGQTMYSMGNAHLALVTKTETQIQQGEADFIEGLQGLNLTSNEVAPGVGIGPNCLEGDSCYPTVHGPVWRVGSFGLQSIGNQGVTDIHLQIGSGGINHAGGNSSQTNVIFAPPDTTNSPIYNAGPNGNRQDILSGEKPEVIIRVSDQLVGDFNNDLTIDGPDLLLWQQTHGQNGSGLPADANDDGVVDGLDLFRWEANFGQTSSGPMAVRVVPEPNCLSLGFFLIFATTTFNLWSRSAGRRTSITTLFVLIFSVASIGLAATSYGVTNWLEPNNGLWGGNANWSNGRPDLGNTARFQDAQLSSNQTINLNANREARGLRQNHSNQTDIRAGDDVANSLTQVAVPEPQGGLMLVLSLAIICYFTTNWRANCRVVVTLTLVSATQMNAHAQRLDWRFSSDGNWGANNNWIDGSGVIGFEDGRVMRFNVGGTYEVRLRGSDQPQLTTWEPQGITFDQTGIVTIDPGPNNDNSLAIGSQGITVDNSSGTLRTKVNLSLRTDQTWNVTNTSGGSDPLLIESGDDFTSTVALGTHELTVNGPGNTSINAAINGTGGLTKRGNGRLSLRGNNTFSGGLDILSGSVRITSASNLGSAGVTLRGSVLDVNQSITINNPLTIIDDGDSSLNIDTNNVTLSGVIGGSGAWSKNGTGRLTLSNNNGFSAYLDINAGEVLVTNQNALGAGALIASGATLWAATPSQDWSNFNVDLRENGKFEKSGVGRLTLTGTNNLFTGSFEVEGGELAGAPSRFNNRPIQTNRSTAEAVFLGAGSYAGGLSGPGKLIKEGSGTLSLSGSNAGHTGGIIVRGGTIAGNDATLRSAVNLDANFAGLGAELALSSSGTFSRQVLGTGNVRKNGTGRTFLSGNNNYSGTLFVQQGTLAGNSTSIQQPVIVSSGANVEFVSSSGTQAFNNLISGSGGLIKSGAGTLTINGSPTYSGTTAVQAGVLSYSNPDLLTSDTVVSAGASLWFGNTPDRLYSGDISGSGQINKKGGSGKLTLTGTNSYTGGTSIEAGTLEGTTDSIRGAVTLLNDSVLVYEQPVVTTQDFTTGPIAGQGTVIKRGPGKLVLTSPHTYSPSHLEIEEGRVSVLASNLLTDVEVGAGASLELQATASNPFQSYAGVIAGSGEIRKAGSDIVLLTGDNTLSGLTTVQGGTLQIGGTMASDGYQINNAATLQLINSITDRLPDDAFINISGTGVLSMVNRGEQIGTLTGSGQIDLGDGFLTVGGGSYSGTITGVGGRITKAGSGSLTLSGINTYSGGTTVAGGTLEGNTSSLQGAIAVGSGAQVLFEQDTSGSFTGTISGGGAFRKRGVGSLTVGGATTHTGGTFVEQGKLVGNTSSLQGNIISDAEVIISQSSNGTFSANLSGSGKLTKIKVGEITISGSNSYAGGTDILAGKLIANPGQTLGTGDVFVAEGATLGGNGTIGGNVTGAGRLAPGNSPGILTINGDYTLSPTSVLEIEVEGTATAGVDYDQLRVGGQVSLGTGTLEFDFTNNPSPALGDKITFLETFGGGEVLTVPSGDEPRLTTIGLDLASNLAVLVTSTTGVGGMVDMELIQASDISFDGTSATANWFTDSDWNTDSNPTSADDTTVGGNVFVQDDIPQRVVVNSSLPMTPNKAQVWQLTVGNTAQQPIVVEVETELNSVTGDVTIAANGGIELDGGILSVPEDRMVEVTESGMLSGNGMVMGSVSLGVNQGQATAMLSPSMSATNADVGTLTIQGSYTQGDSGVLAVDIVGDNSGVIHDVVTVSEAAELGGMLKIDTTLLVSDNAMLGERYELMTIDDTVVGVFDDIVQTARPDIYFQITYETQASTSSDSELAALTFETRTSLIATMRSMGDANADGRVDDEDAMAFATAILDISAPYTYVSGASAGITDYLTRFNFTAGDLDDTRVDVDDIPGFINVYMGSNGVSAAQAYKALEGAFARVQAGPSVPEPAAFSLCMICASLLTGRWRHGRIA